MEELGKLGNLLLNNYVNILKIKKELAIDIIKNNIVAYDFITDEKCLYISGQNDSINLLLGLTLFRDNNIRTPITNDEKIILKEYYNINFYD